MKRPREAAEEVKVESTDERAVGFISEEGL